MKSRNRFKTVAITSANIISVTTESSDVKLQILYTVKYDVNNPSKILANLAIIIWLPFPFIDSDYICCSENDILYDLWIVQL